MDDVASAPPPPVERWPPLCGLVLLGLRGSGKSTLGPRLAERLKRPFIDLDDRTAAACGSASAGEAYARLGETAFRLAEADQLRRGLDEAGAVIALGGGTPTAPGAAALLRAASERGLTRLVYLRASVETLRRRLAAAGVASRPSLTGLGTLDEIERIFLQRDPLYRELARTIDVDRLDEAAAVERVLEAFA